MAVKHIVIMRGAHGAGKTWWHQTKYPQPDKVVCSVDDYLMTLQGYDTSADRPHMAAQRCFRKYMRTLTSPTWRERVVVDNRNLNAVEMAPYIALAEACEVPYEIVHVQPKGVPVETLATRGPHCVSKAKIHRMLVELNNARLPRTWRPEILYTGGAP